MRRYLKLINLVNDRWDFSMRLIDSNVQYNRYTYIWMK